MIRAPDNKSKNISSFILLFICNLIVCSHILAAEIFKYFKFRLNNDWLVGSGATFPFILFLSSFLVSSFLSFFLLLRLIFHHLPPAPTASADPPASLTPAPPAPPTLPSTPPPPLYWWAGSLDRGMVGRSGAGTVEQT